MPKTLKFGQSGNIWPNQVTLNSSLLPVVWPDWALLWEFLETNLLTKLAQMFVDFLGDLKNIKFSVLHAVDFSWATFGENLTSLNFNIWSQFSYVNSLDHICALIFDDLVWPDFATLAKIENYWQLFEGLLFVWQNFEPTLENYVWYWQWPNIKQII